MNLKFFYKILFTSVLVSSFAACQKEIEAEFIPPVKEMEYTKYTIPAGEQFATHNPLTNVVYEELVFMVKFDSSAIYTTIDTANQRDVNKLYGFADNNAHHSQFSARFGWRWKDNELHLFSYIYNNGIRADNDIGKIEIGKENLCSIKVSGASYIFSLNGVTSTWPRASTTAKAIGYKLYPYFGGDEMAPHTICIWIKEL